MLGSAGLGAGAGGRRTGRRGRDTSTRPGPGRGATTPAAGRDPQHDQHPAGRRCRSTTSSTTAARGGFSAASPFCPWSPVIALAARSGPLISRSRTARRASPPSSSPSGIRGFPGHRRPRGALAHAAGRMGKPRAAAILPARRGAHEVVYHHRGAYLGIGLWSPGPWGYAQSTDQYSAFPLQRLVPHLDDAGGRRHADLLPRRPRRTSTTPSPTRA